MRRIYIDIPSITPTSESEALKSIFQEANKDLQNEKAAQLANEQIEKRYKAEMQKIMDQLQEDLNPIGIHFNTIDTQTYKDAEYLSRHIRGSMVLKISIVKSKSGISEGMILKDILLRIPANDKIGPNPIYNGTPEIFLMRNTRTDSSFNTVIDDFYRENKEIIIKKYKKTNQ